MHNTEGIMIREFFYREDEVCLLVRRKDSFPVATVGNTEGLFGITDEAFSRDDTELFRAMKEPEKGYAFSENTACGTAKRRFPPKLK